VLEADDGNLLGFILDKEVSGCIRSFDDKLRPKRAGYLEAAHLFVKGGL
jgi:hypothetical protein